jgi:hypothetical protein
MNNSPEIGDIFSTDICFKYSWKGVGAEWIRLKQVESDKFTLKGKLTKDQLRVILEEYVERVLDMVEVK